MVRDLFGYGAWPTMPRAGMAVQGAASPNEKGPPRRTARVREERFTFGRYG